MLIDSAQSHDARTFLSDNDYFVQWRQRELSRVDAEGLVYADYTGAALYPQSLIEADAERLRSNVYGNPHSEHLASRRSTDVLEAARQAILEFVNASPHEYQVVLTANASAACRLVGEAFPFTSRSELLLTADNHNSINGIREFARRAGAQCRSIALNSDFELLDAEDALGNYPTGDPSLFAFPAQSNFSGVRHPLSLIELAQSRRWRVLLDAASFLPTADLDLTTIKPDFVVMSIYKIIGYPAGVGALIARRDALEQLDRPWFAGGTVRWVSVGRGAYLAAHGVDRFEDGTPAFTAVGAVPLALQAAVECGRSRLASQCNALTHEMLAQLEALRHGNGHQLIRVVAPQRERRGPTIAFTLHSATGANIPYWQVEQDARDAGIAIRGGCFCNPGCAEAAFELGSDRAVACLELLGDAFSIPAFSTCLGENAVGALRISFGIGSVASDVEAISRFLSRYLETR